MQNQQKQQVSFEDLQLKRDRTEQQQSQSCEIYAKIIKPSQVNHQQIKQRLQRNGILYDCTSASQYFYFQVEKILPCFDFYRLYVKLSHFKLTIDVVKYFGASTTLTNCHAKGRYGKIYFANLEKITICLKSFSFFEEQNFQKLFIQVVRQWSILKICSSLQCAPHLQKYLGFDIIIYDDCIQFALQQGEQLSQLSNSQITELKDQLRLMHQFKIIHYDIKPQNIIFSQYYNKPVFIDFGFSQIIKESLGSKTITKFKGTPNFCSYQMLAIILDQQQAFIDLYYNDAYGLIQTCRCLSQSLIYPCKSNIYEGINDEFCQEVNQYKKEEFVDYVQKNKMENLFIFFAFQYHYVNGNEEKSNQFFTKLIDKNKQNLRYILQFIKKGINFIFLPNFFSQNQEILKKSVLYNQILQKKKLGMQLMHFQQKRSDQNKEKEFDLRIINLLSMQQFNNVSIHSYDQYFKTIINITKINPQLIQYYLAIVFKCVRFDQKNLGLSFKVQIAKKLNPLLIDFFRNRSSFPNSSQIKEQNQNIRHLKLLMRILLYYCLNQKLSMWIKKHVFDVLQQIIILNDECFLFTNQLLQFLSLHQKEFQILQVAFELKKILESTWLIKTQFIDRYTCFKQILQNSIQSRFNQFKEKYRYSKDIQLAATYNLLDILGRKKIFHKQPSFVKEHQLLANITNPNIRKHLYLWLISNKIIIFNSIFKPALILQIAQSIKKQRDIINLNFLSRAKIITDIMLISCNFNSMQKYYNYIKEVINCFQLCSHFKLAISQNNYIYELDYNQKIDKLIKKLPFLDRHQTVYQFICLIFNYQVDQQQIKIHSSLHIPKMIELYNKYNQCKDQQIVQSKDDKYFILFHQVKIQSFFYSLCEQTRQLFIKSLDQYQKQLQAFIVKYYGVQIEIRQFFYLKMKVLLYKFYKTIYQQKDQQFLKCFVEVVKLGLTLNLNCLIIQIVKLANSKSCIWKNKQIIIYSSQIFYNFCKVYQDFSFYLIPDNKMYLLNALHTFARQDKKTFHELLLKLTQFLSCNPIHATKSYFISLIKSIDQFIKKDSSFCYLIHYSQFLGQSSFYKLQNNPYLLIFYTYSLFNQNCNSQLKLLKIFALHCELLSNFARKKLLEKYFIVFLCIIGQKSKRQKIFVYRKANNYLETKMKKKQIKELFKISKNTRFHLNLKAKIRYLLQQNI